MTLTSSHPGRRVAGCRRKSALILGPFWVLGPIPDDLHILTILPHKRPTEVDTWRYFPHFRGTQRWNNLSKISQ